MKNYFLKSVFSMVLCLFLYSGTARANMPIEKQSDKVSEVASSKTQTERVLKPNVLKMHVKSLTFKEKIKLFREVRKETKNARKSGVKETPKVVLYILAVILPPIAVGIYTDWSISTLWNLLWTLCFWLPGIIHAFYIIL